MSFPKVYVSPMSKDIISAIKKINKFGFVATRHQISDDGYVSKDCYLLKTDIICERDHGGNNLNDYLNDVSQGYGILHVDVWKDSNFETSIERTIQIIEYVNSIFPDVVFEVGTEEKVFKYSSDEFDYMLNKMKLILGEDVFKKIKYAVIQGGAKVFNCQNIDFNETQFKEMVEICKFYKVLSKEHNCDFIDKDIMRKRLELGLGSYNIGPELIFKQNIAILKTLAVDDINKIYQFCYDKNEWQRWTDNDELIVPTTLHYYYNELKINKRINMNKYIQEIVC